ncbi:MAG: hypothetical protein ACE5MH_02850 [Terriglobia bacterium]
MSKLRFVNQKLGKRVSRARELERRRLAARCRPRGRRAEASR